MDSIQQILEKLPKKEREQFVKIAQGLKSGEALESHIKKNLETMAASEFSPRAFAAFYRRLHGNKLPPHAMEHWIKPIFEAKKEDKGAEILAFRGSWKTTTITITFQAFFIGHHPKRANLIIQASDAAANDSAASVKNIIEHTDAWKNIFPHIVPDKKQGWGEQGYEVKRTDIDYEKWQEMTSAKRDPTLLGLGITSKTLIGRHPDGLLLMDDILDEEITSSVRQMQSVENKVLGTILPFIVEDDAQPEGERMLTWPIVIGTPWVDGDVYEVLKNTGEFTFTKVPIMEACGKNDPDAVFFDHEKLTGHYELTWSDRHSKDTIIRFYNRSGHKEFMRMYMLDLSVQAEGEGLKFHTYPHSRIDARWPMVCGVDYASIIREQSLDFKNRSYYAQAYLMKMPDGRGVIFDGIHDRCTQAEAESHMEAAESFQGHRCTVFEGDGKGEEALQTFLRNPGLTIVPMKTGGKGKKDRLERQLGPWLENGTILISDGNTPFLNFLRKNLRKYPMWFTDGIDAVYWAMRGMPEILQLPEKDKNELPSVKRARKESNPFHAFAN